MAPSFSISLQVLHLNMVSVKLCPEGMQFHVKTAGNKIIPNRRTNRRKIDADARAHIETHYQGDGTTNAKRIL